MNAAPATAEGRELQTGLMPTPVFPVDLSTWLGTPDLLQLVSASASRSSGTSWLHLISEDAPQQPADDLLVLVAYCYLQGVYHSIDVLRRLETDPNLQGLRERCAFRTEQVRRFRRDHRRALTDCLTRAFISLWQRRAFPAALPNRIPPNTPANGRPDFGFLEPFYLQAQDRIDRAVVFDSMALDE